MNCIVIFHVSLVSFNLCFSVHRCLCIFFVFLALFFFFFDRARSSSLHVDFLQLAIQWRSGATLQLQCTAFSLQWLLLLHSTGSKRAGFSSCSLLALECRLSSCAPSAQLLLSVWNLPRPEIELVFSTLQGGLLTTGSPGKPGIDIFEEYRSVVLLTVPQSEFS